jgi:hypothetical protein
MMPSVALRTGTRVEKINSKHDSRAGTVTSSLLPEMWHGRVHGGVGRLQDPRFRCW